MMRNYEQDQTQNESIDHEYMKEQLTTAVAPIQFTEDMKLKVLDQAQKSIPIWEREITISLPLAAIAVCVMIGLGIYTIPHTLSPTVEQKSLKNNVVQIGPNYFWESDVKGAHK